MRYAYEFEFYHGEKNLLAIPFDFEGGTFGEDPKDTIESAADWLIETINDHLLHDKELPNPTFLNEPKNGGRIVAVSVDTNLDNIESVSAYDASKVLGVSKSRISQLIKSGKLDSFKRGRSVFVTVESLSARAKECPSAGRPKNICKDEDFVDIEYRIFMEEGNNFSVPK